MPQGKSLQRTPAQKEADLATVSKLLAIGYKPRAILDRINAQRSNKLCLRTIQFDIVRARRHWLETAERNIEVHIERELRLLDYIGTEALEAWEASKGPKIQQEQSEAKGTARRFGNYDGASEFLNVAVRCSEQRRKLLGIDRERERHRTDPLADDPTRRATKMVLEIVALPEWSDETEQLATGTGGGNTIAEESEKHLAARPPNQGFPP